MLFNIRGENIEVTQAIREYVESKVDKIEKYFDGGIEAMANVNLKVYKNGQKVEVTIPMSGLVLRAEDTNSDLYAAIDLVVDKLERQIRKYKTKVNRKMREKGSKHALFATLPEDSGVTDEKDDEIKIVRRKSFELQPMSSEEAVLQMDMLGHNFFVYLDDKSGTPSVVYRRSEDTYGLIETE